MEKAEGYLTGASFKCSNLDHFNQLSSAFEVGLPLFLLIFEVGLPLFLLIFELGLPLFLLIIAAEVLLISDDTVSQRS